MRSRNAAAVAAALFASAHAFSLPCADAFAPPTYLLRSRAPGPSAPPPLSSRSNSAAAVRLDPSRTEPTGNDEEVAVADRSRRDALTKGAAVAVAALFGGNAAPRRAEATATAAVATAAVSDLASSAAATAARGSKGGGGAAGESGVAFRNLAAVTVGPSAVAMAGSSVAAQPSTSSRRSQSGIRESPAASGAASAEIRPAASRRERLRRAARTAMRVGRILMLATPAVLKYPRARRSEEAYARWLEFCMRQCERGGAVVIKMAQWASSRPDIFGTTFCDAFKRLQDGTTPHAWEHTEEILSQCYGEDWKEHLRIEPDAVLGSGCIAQVYKGRIDSGDDGTEEKEVAVKVVHPGVRKGIEDDISILRGLAHLLERLPYGYGEKLKWNNLSGMVEEFARMLKPQLDLRNEAEHLRRFNEQFKDSAEVLFPQTVGAYQSHPDVLVETFCTGVPIEKFCRDNAENEDLRAKLCEVACRTVTTMIFANNYVHGDLHPGNVFVSPDHKLVLLDCGIVNEYDDADHDLLVNIIAAFIRMDGRRAAELMAGDAERRLAGTGESVKDAEGYVAAIERLSKTPRKTDFAFEKVTTYVDYIFNAAARHHVIMNSVFVSIMLAVKVQEGVCLLLNPEIETVKIANPIILKSEAERMKRGGSQAMVDLMRQQAEDVLRNFRVKVDRQMTKAKVALEGAS